VAPPSKSANPNSKLGNAPQTHTPCYVPPRHERIPRLWDWTYSGSQCAGIAPVFSASQNAGCFYPRMRPIEHVLLENKSGIQSDFGEHLRSTGIKWTGRTIYARSEWIPVRGESGAEGIRNPGWDRRSLDRSQISWLTQPIIRNEGSPIPIEEGLIVNIVSMIRNWTLRYRPRIGILISRHVKIKLNALLYAGCGEN